MLLLSQSLARLDPPVRSVLVTDETEPVSWHKGLEFKLTALAWFRSNLDGPLLWVDADAVVHSLSQMNQQANCVMAMRRRGDTYLTGTIWMRDTPVIKQFFDAWLYVHRMMDGSPTTQQSLSVALSDGSIHVADLPRSMCWIFDEEGERPNPLYIEHLQASRDVNREQHSDEQRDSRYARIAYLKETWSND
jgi:hypothetical protein